MRALFTGDIHMNNALPFARPSLNGHTDRFDDQLYFWAQVRRYADEHDIGHVFILGDLFDKKLLDAVTLTGTVAALSAFKQKIHIVPGNHDASSLAATRFTVEVFNSVRHADDDTVFHVFHSGEVLFFGEVAFLAMPYASVEKNRETLAAIRAAMTSYSSAHNVLLMHNSIIGCRHLGWVCDDGLSPEEVCDLFSNVISGHFHTSQRFGVDDEGLYLGAPQQHTFGDAGEVRGFWDITFAKDAPMDAKLVPVESPNFHVANGMEALPDVLLDVKHGDYLRLVIEATHADWAVIKPKAVATVGMLCSDGIRAHVKHKPIYHHEARKTLETGRATLSVAEMVERYVDASGVILGGLDRVTLKKVGREAMASVKAR